MKEIRRPYRLAWYCLLFLLGAACLEGQPHHPYVSEEVWQQLTPYLMPEGHPLRRPLDRLFSERRVLRNKKALKRAGFVDPQRQPHTKVIVTRHREMKGYIFKIYTDDQPYYRDLPEHQIWMLRARGAALVRQEIAAQGWGHLFKAPKKWIYPLPPTPAATSGALAKNFILVEKDMEILSNEKSWKRWRDGTVTHDHLDMLFYLVTKIGLRGGCKADNIPFCKDGRIAFVDTEKNLIWPLPYQRLFQVLEGDLAAHWQRLIDAKAQQKSAITYAELLEVK